VRAALLAFATSTALTASTLALVGSPAEGRAVVPAARAVQKASLTVSPGIAQNGARVASANNALVVGGATFRPARKGRVVTLQRRLGPTGTWASVTRGREAANGVYRFKAARSSHGTPYTYRVVAARASGLARVVTNEVSSEEWTLAFDEPFSGSRLDAKKWSYRNLGVREGSRTRSQSSTRAVHVSSGALKLEVRRHPTRKNNYLNGTISTSGKFSYTYGYAAARIKFAKGRGQHGGFWMQPQVQASRYGSPARTGAEIDIAEFFGKGYSNGGLAHFLYTYPRKGKTTKYGDVFRRASTALAGKSDSWWSRYHVFSVQWTASGYVFRIDGTETWRSSKALSRQPEYVILSQFTSDWELKYLDRKTLPTSMKVDWVRVWQR
jgi:beta-glucanase (GH16 family)